jgi:hypothetical protein
MTCSGAQLDSGNSVVGCSITREKGPPYAFIKLRSVQEASTALAFNGIQFRGSTLKVRRCCACVGARVRALGEGGGVRAPGCRRSAPLLPTC